MATHSCAQCGKTWEARGPVKDGVRCDECKAAKANPSNIQERLQYLNELRHLLPISKPPHREMVERRINAVCASLDDAMGINGEELPQIVKTLP